MELFLARRFVHRYEKLPPAVRNQVRAALEDITLSPLDGKRLSGPLEGEYSWRVGRYRIIYTVDDGRITAETVGHRKEIYR